MFAKLLKAEFRAVQGGLAAVCASALLAGLLGGFFLRYLLDADRGLHDEEGTLFLVCCLVVAGAVLALMVCSAAAAILLLGRFYRSRFTDEGYLTFTLPVNTHQILLSSLVSALLCLALVGFVIGGSFVVLILLGLSGDSDFWWWFQGFPQELAAALQRLDLNHYAILAQALFLLITGVLWEVICLMLAITVGALAARKHKILAAVGLYYLIHVAVQILQVVIMSGALTTENALLLPSLFSLLLAAGGYLLTYRLVDRKLNLP